MTLFYWDVMSELEIVDCFENDEALTDSGYPHILKTLCIKKTEDLARDVVF